MQPRKANFLIIGSAKCGTTALASILDLHPDCCMSRPKEVSFFQDTMDFMPNPNYEKGWDWYQKAFAHYNGESLVGEATPSYSDRSRSPNTAKRIFDFNLDMKIIYMVRDPLERQISAWKMQWVLGRGRSKPWRREYQWAIEGFESWIKKQRDAGQWDVCRYEFQLEAYREQFQDTQILVSILEDWREDKDAEVSRIMNFLRLDPALWDRSIKESANRGEDRTIERRWFKHLSRQPLLRRAAEYAPAALKQTVSKKLGRVEASPPPIDLNSQIVTEFLDYVSEDCLALIQRIGKDPNKWSSLANCNS